MIRAVSIILFQEYRMADGYRVERDSMGELSVPEEALWGAQTQRAVNNFPISDLVMPRAFIRALGLVKWAAAGANSELGLMPSATAVAIQTAAMEVAEGTHDAHFPIDVFQTGSGTSSNMNANEVIAHLASGNLGAGVHPNDDVNMGQSSNDVIPTAVHVSAAIVLAEELLPALSHLEQTLATKAAETADIIKTGRTHLMDAMPVSLGQELGGWRSQIGHCIERLQSVLPRLCQLAQGGTAVGTGINAHPKFGPKVAVLLSESTGLEFSTAENYFEALSSQDTRRGSLRPPEDPGSRAAENCQRPALDEQWASGRTRRNYLTGLATGQQHHAGQNKSGDTGSRGHGRRAGDWQRCCYYDCRSVGYRRFSGQ
jgi:fumarate hydratase class II